MSEQNTAARLAFDKVNENINGTLTIEQQDEFANAYIEWLELQMLDLNGELILDSCNCDENLCNYPPCVMEQDRYAAEMKRQFDTGMLDPPKELRERETDISDVWDNGGHKYASS